MNTVSSLPALPQVKLWPAVGKLIRLRWVIVVSNFKRARLRSKIGAIALGLLVVGGMVAVLYLAG